MRELTGKNTWEIDTLFEANADGDGEVVTDLLQQIALAAEEAEVTHVVLRTLADSAAIDLAVSCGFARIVDERLWSGRLRPAGLEGQSVREWQPGDGFASFQVAAPCRSTRARRWR